MKILGWITFVLTALNLLFNLFGKEKPLERFAIFILQIPMIVYIGYSLFYLH